MRRKDDGRSQLQIAVITQVGRFRGFNCHDSTASPATRTAQPKSPTFPSRSVTWGCAIPSARSSVIGRKFDASRSPEGRFQALSPGFRRLRLTALPEPQVAPRRALIEPSVTSPADQACVTESGRIFEPPAHCYCGQLAPGQRTCRGVTQAASCRKSSSNSGWARNQPATASSSSSSSWN